MEQIAKEEFITKQYYFTGGTALSECYLHHRLSEDLDFFTNDDLNEDHLDDFFAHISPLVDCKKVNKIKHYQMIFYYLTFSDGSKLRNDFVNMDNQQIEKETFYNKTALRVDSIFDIALNKFKAISDRSHARDYVDLYFILKTQDIALEQVNSRMFDKFAPFSYNDTLQILERITGVIDIVTDYPKMLVPFDKREMQKFYLSEAKKLEKKIFK